MWKFLNAKKFFISEKEMAANRPKNKRRFLCLVIVRYGYLAIQWRDFTGDSRHKWRTCNGKAMFNFDSSSLHF